MTRNLKATVYVSLKDGVLDPQGATIHKALSQMGYTDILSVRSGRFFELELKPDSADVDAQIEDVCSKLLANPVIERFTVKR